MSENTKPTGDAVGFQDGGRGAAPFTGSQYTPGRTGCAAYQGSHGSRGCV
jgi:hypothetical protein